MRIVPAALALAAALSGACVSNRLAPGVLREDWNQPRRDPDPTRNPTAEPTGNPWATETEDRIPPPGEARPAPDEPTAQDRRTVDFAKRGAATFLAWAAAGWIPLIEWSGTFEEDPAQRARLKAKTDD